MRDSSIKSMTTEPRASAIIGARSVASTTVPLTVTRVVSPCFSLVKFTATFVLLVYVISNQG